MKCDIKTYMTHDCMDPRFPLEPLRQCHFCLKKTCKITRSLHVISGFSHSSEYPLTICHDCSQRTFCNSQFEKLVKEEAAKYKN